MKKGILLSLLFVAHILPAQTSPKSPFWEIEKKPRMTYLPGYEYVYDYNTQVEILGWIYDRKLGKLVKMLPENNDTLTVVKTGQAPLVVSKEYYFNGTTVVSRLDTMSVDTTEKYLYDQKVVSRFLSVDPLTKSYPELTPYQFASNTPIQDIDLDGLEGKPAQYTSMGSTTAQSSTFVNLPSDKQIEQYQYKAPTQALNSPQLSDPCPGCSDLERERKRQERDATNTKKELENQIYENPQNAGAPGTSFMVMKGVKDGLALEFMGYGIAKGIGATYSFLKGISTPYGTALQSFSKEALAVKNSISETTTLYKIGVVGKSENAGSQFWSTENPLEIGIENFAKKYGIPEENLKGDLFIQTGTLKKGANFVTNEAVGIGENTGGGIQVVTGTNDVQLQTFSTIKR